MLVWIEATDVFNVRHDRYQMRDGQWAHRIEGPHIEIAVGSKIVKGRNPTSLVGVWETTMRLACIGRRMSSTYHVTANN